MCPPGTFPPQHFCVLEMFHNKVLGNDAHALRAISLTTVYPSKRQLVCALKKDPIGTFIFALISLFVIGKHWKQSNAYQPPLPWIG